MTTSASTRAEPAPRQRGGLLRHPDFMKLWAAETVSQFGTQVTALAIPLLAILVLDVTAFELALVNTFDFLPFVLVSLPAGVWVDRMRRRPILIVADIGRALLLLSIPVAWVANALTIWQIYVVGFSVGILTVFFDVAYQSYLPRLVDRDQLVEGNAKLDISRSGAQIAGPGIAGVLIGALTAPIAILADALSFLVSAFFLFLIRRPEPPVERERSADGSGPSMRTQVAEGLRYVLGHRFLRNIAACTALSNFFSNVALAVWLIYVVRDLGLLPEEIGVVFGLSNVGFLLGALLANRIAKVLGVGWTIIVSSFLTGPAMLAIALAPRDLAIPVILVALAVIGFSVVVYNVNQVSLRQAITPDGMQGRMNATMRFIVWGTIPAGAILGGILGTTLGIYPTLLIGALGGFVPILPVLFSPVRGIREMPADGVEARDPVG